MVAGILLIAAAAGLSLVHLSVSHTNCTQFHPANAPNPPLWLRNAGSQVNPNSAAPIRHQTRTVAASALLAHADATKRNNLKQQIRTLADAQTTVYQALQVETIGGGEGDGREVETEVRAVMVELGADRSKFLTEFKWILRSWINVRNDEMRRREESPDGPILLTDLIVFTDLGHVDMVSALVDLGCETPRARRSRVELPTCYLEHYVRLPTRATLPNATELARDLRHYNYIDSINILAEFEGFPYDFVLRSDLDTFLAPDWSITRILDIFPTPKSVLLGEGYYIVDGEQYQTVAHLMYVARRLGLRTPTVNNLGTTWGGPLRLARITAQLQVQIIRWLDLYEFTAFDRCCAGTSGWPNWHWGVLTLYAGHLAMNNLPHVHRRRGIFDHATTGKAQLVGSGVLHLHVLHGNMTFSKSEFAAGAYRKLDPATLDRTTAGGFATHVAVEASRLAPSELKAMIDNPS
jgi:hypothetical protein